MKRRVVVAAAVVVAGCAQMRGGGWVTLVDGERGLENFSRVGDANWRAENGAIVADHGKGGLLVSKNQYTDFEIRAEFWAQTDTNSGVYIRCADPMKIASANCYEVNIWDIRPDPKYATGAIVDVAAVPVPLVHKAGGRWNTYEITARGAGDDRAVERRPDERWPRRQASVRSFRASIRPRDQGRGKRPDQVAQGADPAALSRKLVTVTVF